MYEAFEVMGFVLWGALGLYLTALWGSAVFSWVYGDFLHDGEKKVKALICFIADPEDKGDYYWVYLGYGIMLPMTYGVIAMFLILVTERTGMLTPYICMGIAASFACLYIFRAVIRLNKKLDKHASDKKAHK